MRASGKLETSRFQLGARAVRSIDRTLREVRRGI